MTTDKVLDKLSKLKAARDGEAKIGNQAAAEAFAEAINRLLLQHELSEVDIPLTAEQDPIIEVMADLKAHDIKFSRVRIGWQEALARIVAPAHLCRFLVTAGTNYVTFVGTRSHATVAEYAYGTLAAAADKMSKAARDDYWRQFRNDPGFESGNFRAAWLSGFIARIGERFKEVRAAEVHAAAQGIPGGSSTALVKLDGALIRVNGYMDDKYKTRVRAAAVQTGCRTGYQEGRAAADAMPIGRRAVGDAGRRQLK